MENLIYDNCLHVLENYISYIQSIHIVSKNTCIYGVLHKVYWYSKTRCVSTIRNYAERMSINFNLEIQSERFGNGRSLSIEGYNLKIVG